MEEEIEMHLGEAKELMDKAVEHTQKELVKIRAGKAQPSMLNGLLVDYYGSKTPIDQVASISTPDARTITIKPWEKSVISEIERTIMNSDLGITPQSDGELVRLNIPALTEERRKELVKKAKNEGEHGKISVRNIRKDINDGLKKLLKEGASEDMIKNAEANVQEMTDKHIKHIDEILAVKEKDIMTV